MSPQRAVELKLVDKLGYPEEAADGRARARPRASSVAIADYGPRRATARP